jgi:excinuclease ABC subunit C
MQGKNESLTAGRGGGSARLLPAASDIPVGPGVYVMRDGEGAVLYVGKAKSLRSRLRSYREGSRQGVKTMLLLSRVKDVETIVTDTELEALILENSLIKKYRPRYNVTLRDDKTYPFLRLSVQEEFPRLTIVRRPEDDGAKYFGPYVPAGAMRRTLKILERTFPLRRCRKPLRGMKQRGCLNFQMGRCLAPCAGKVTAAEYGELVQGVLLFLSGKGSRLAAEYRRRMRLHASRREYEEAALLRDRAAAIDATLERQKVHLPGKGDRDIIGMARLGGRSVVTVLEARQGRITGVRTVNVLESMDEDRETLAEFLRIYYDRSSFIPAEIVLPFAPDGAEAAEAWLSMKRGGRMAFVIPRIGPARSLVNMASRNALENLEKGKSPENTSLAGLARLLEEENVPGSLAAMDVSNLAGTDTTASLVWWEEGRFRKKRYRRFRIRETRRGDDYAAMSEAVRRLVKRVERREWPGPDVLLLDGGRGHLATVRDLLGGSGWKPTILLAIAKAGVRGGEDAVYAGKRGSLVDMKGENGLLHLLQAARDEAHRFAVSHHRILRKARNRRSSLDDAPGIGPVRRKLLLKRFGSLKALRCAAREELLAVEGLPTAVAEDLYAYLQTSAASAKNGRE